MSVKGQKLQMPCELRWASTSGAHTMPLPEQMEAKGWQRTGIEDPRFPGSVLMWKPA